MLAKWLPPPQGHHHDLYEIQTLFEQLTQLLQAAGIDLKGVVLNADPGVEERYKPRAVIEQANLCAVAYAWLDSFKTLLVRFETLLITWVALHLLAFSVLFLRKLNKN